MKTITVIIDTFEAVDLLAVAAVVMAIYVYF